MKFVSRDSNSALTLSTSITLTSYTKHQILSFVTYKVRKPGKPFDKADVIIFKNNVKHLSTQSAHKNKCEVLYLSKSHARKF